MYTDGSRVFAFLTSIVLVYGMYAQVVKMFKTKSAKDFTMALLVALLLDEIAWLNYGITIREWPVFMLGAISLPAAILALTGYLKYGR
ncbi:MAG: SemiSWEET family transporter [Patescibacteria group bacterium]|nr:SemiSWEET family transporter [Patescibacteria group bacterium]